MNKRNDYLDILKAISIILVVFGHCIQYGSGWEYSKGSFYGNPIFMIIYSFHMPLFMLISGYLFAYSLERKRENKVLHVKFLQLIIPLFCWSVIFPFISIVTKLAMGKSLETITVLWIVKKIISGFIYNNWFLWAVWWCSFIVIIVRRFFKDSPLVYIVATLLTFIIPDVLNCSLYKYMWPFFLLAYMFNRYDYKSKLKKIYMNKIFILYSVVVFVILLLFYNYDSYIYTSGYCIFGKNAIVQIYNNCFRFIIGMFGSISVMFLVYALVKVLPNKMKKAMVYIGKNTLGIYIMSCPINWYVLPFVSTKLTGVNYLYVLIETVCVLIFTIVLNAILKRFKMTNKLLLGGRA